MSPGPADPPLADLGNTYAEDGPLQKWECELTWGAGSNADLWHGLS